jgi:hypothetical protein
MMGNLRITDKMPQFVENSQSKALRGVTQALILGASEASVLTAIDTSTLLNSQYRVTEKQGNKIVGRVGYTADHALPVHDPSNPQNFRRPTAEKEFLRKGFERAAEPISDVIAGSLRT